MRDSLPAFHHHISGRSPRTIAIYEAVLQLFWNFLDENSAGSAPPATTLVERFLARRRRDGGHRAAATRNQELAALRVFAKFAKRDLGWPMDPTVDIPFTDEPRRIPAVLTAHEVTRSFEEVGSLPPSIERSRNLAMLALFSQTGLRVHELVLLDVDQIDLATGALLRVKGKGGTLRQIELNEPAVLLVGAWIGDRAGYVAPGERALFVSSRRTRISIRTIQRMVEHLREALGLAKRATAHTFRHTFITLELLAGTDLATIAGLAGHTNLNTTARYIHCLDVLRRQAVGKVAYTVPVSVLPPGEPNATVRTLDIGRLPTFPELASSPPPQALDVQERLSAAA